MGVGAIYLLVVGILLVISSIKDINKTKQALKVTYKMSIMIFPVFFFIFVLMGLFQAFVSREVIAKWFGYGNGPLTVFLGELVGCIALIEPPVVFPFAGFLLEKGANYGAILGFVMTAILIGIVTMPLEFKLFGVKFSIVRNVLVLIFFFIMGLLFRVVL